MHSEKQGLVLLPFLAQAQLRGFYTVECSGISWEEFQKEWKERQQHLPRVWEDPGCYFEPASEEVREDWISAEELERYYEKDMVEVGWIHGIKNIIPIRPFIALDDCERLIEQLDERDDEQSLKLKNFRRVSQKKIYVRDRDMKSVMVISNERELRIKRMEVKPVERSNELYVTVVIGRQSPFIELIHHQERFFLINGLHRLYAFMKKGYNRVPCVLVNEEEYKNVLDKHPYAINILNDSRPPLLEDFFNSSIAFKMKLQTGIKQIQITMQENLLPITFDSF
ncbi:hypothetical protein BSNK01_17870 [Bacillaceae bacterium]